jgi:hypothetical protein
VLNQFGALCLGKRERGCKELATLVAHGLRDISARSPTGAPSGAGATRMLAVARPGTTKIMVANSAPASARAP